MRSSYCLINHAALRGQRQFFAMHFCFLKWSCLLLTNAFFLVIATGMYRAFCLLSCYYGNFRSSLSFLLIFFYFFLFFHFLFSLVFFSYSIFLLRFFFLSFFSLFFFSFTFFSLFLSFFLSHFSSHYFFLSHFYYIFHSTWKYVMNNKNENF